MANHFRAAYATTCMQPSNQQRQRKREGQRKRGREAREGSYVIEYLAVVQLQIFVLTANANNKNNFYQKMPFEITKKPWL